MSFDTLAMPQDLLPKGADKCLRTLLGSREGFDLYRAIDNELFMTLANAPRRLLVASAMPQDGRTTLALLLACLAATFSSEGRVLLVEAALAPNGIQGRMGMQSSMRGFNQYNVEGGDWRELVQKTPLENLDLLPAGDCTWRHAKLSQSSFGRLMEESVDAYRWVVVDSPPGGVNVDVVSMANLMDAILMVIRYGGPTREQINPLAERLRATQAHMLGAVLNQRLYPVPKLFYGATSY